MKLYHGTCEDNAFEIYKSGFLEPNPNNSESATEYIDNLFERYTGKRVRENAIYFWDNIIDTHGYECVVKVNLDDIELNKLYVGDCNSVNDLYHHRDVNEFSIDMSEEEFDHFNMSAQAPDFRHGDSAPFYFDKEIKSLERKNIEFYRKILN